MVTEQSDMLDGGLWVSITQLADMKGVGKAWISERVKSLEAAGKIVTRAEGRSKLVNVAQYDRAVGEVGDAIKEIAAETKAEADTEGAGNSALRDHQARAAQYGADLKFIELQEKLGNLVPVDDLTDAANKCAEACVRAIDRITRHSESMAAAVGKEGAAGARAKFKAVARELRNEIAIAFGDLAGEAIPISLPPTDGTVSDA